jgi:hypothetical protein
VPALEAGVVLSEQRLGGRVVVLESLEPRDARVPVAELAVRLRLVEMLPERERLGGVEAERPEAIQPLVTLHGVRTPAPASHARRRCGAERGRG